MSAIPNTSRNSATNNMADMRATWDSVQEVEKATPDSRMVVATGQSRQLLNLPLDILRIIVEQVTHTADLCSLALTHSALYALAVPRIYSRFDIVWPDENSPLDRETGVDALSYGLATLVMNHDISRRLRTQEHYFCDKCSFSGPCCHVTKDGVQHVRGGNCLAQFTRTFSLGNGPEHWVRDYLLTKEAGKMLGTLVALAVGRMENLETFVWDMPTGIVRDIWMSLASLGNRNRDHNENCKLQTVWVRLHNNIQSATNSRATWNPLTAQGSGLPTLLNGTTAPRFYVPLYPRVQSPTFSVLPPLKSLSVLDIDEVSYAEELSILIARSVHKLRSLRIGMAKHAARLSWARSQNEFVSSMSPPDSAIGSTQRKKGLLGILLSRLSDCPAPLPPVLGNRHKMKTHHCSNHNFTNSCCSCPEATDPQSNPVESNDDSLGRLSAKLSAQDINSRSSVEPGTPTPNLTLSRDSPHQKCKKLEITVFELERVSLSASLLLRAIDWSILKSLTILGCGNVERLWKVLWKKFAPPENKRISIVSGDQPPSASSGDTSSIRTPVPAHEGSTKYVLKVIKLRTDTVSSTLLGFIKDTLALDTLEEIFLQRSNDWSTTVTVEQIYKHVIRRHRRSLKKLMVDSEPYVPSSLAAAHSEWCFSKELITCITNGRMELRELSLSIDHKDWHFFMQRLPEMLSLRSLHIRHIFRTPTPTSPRERAQQVVNVVALRPELQLCYVAISTRCYEILEISQSQPSATVSWRLNDPPRYPPGFIGSDADDDWSNDGLATSGGVANTLTLNANTDQVSSDTDSMSDDGSLGTSTDGSDEEISFAPKRPTFRLREILFYDDKVAIFKARHGRL